MDLSLILSPTIVIWSLLTVVVGIVVGFVVGRSYTLANEPTQLQEDREKTLLALKKLLASTEQFNTDVGSHNKELSTVRQSVCEMSDGSDNGLESVQQVLIDKISEVVESNKKMENDLVITKYQLEEQAQEIDRTRKEARTDQLSGLENRKAFDEALSYLLSRHRTQSTPFALILCDIDHFKRINDTFGHQAGDAIVQRIGDSLKEQTRPTDHVARFGGDEFAVLLENVDSKIARDIAIRMRGNVERKNFAVDGVHAEIAVTLSVGVTVVNEDDTEETVLKRADEALYRSKELGRNQVHSWTEENSMERCLN